MRILKIILISIGIIIILALAFIWHAGAFSKLIVEEKQSKTYIIVGELFTGPYYKVNTPMTHVDSTLRTLGIKSSLGFGIYYDDPKSTPEEQCKSFVGNVINAADLNQQTAIEKLGLKIDTIESSPSIIIDFPSKNKLSYMIGPMRAYPMLVKYAKEKKLSPTLAIEIYDIPKESTLFIMQLNSK